MDEPPVEDDIASCPGPSPRPGDSSQLHYAASPWEQSASSLGQHFERLCAQKVLLKRRVSRGVPHQPHLNPRQPNLQMAPPEHSPPAASPEPPAAHIAYPPRTASDRSPSTPTDAP